MSNAITTKESKTNTKQFESTKKYIDALSANYSKINVVRMDLSYKKPHSDNMTLEDANKDINHMLSNRRSKPSIFKDQIGYVCMREYTEDRGVHFHTLFLYDGQKVVKDAHKADQIGEYWKNEITEGKGSYHNCNRNEYKQKGVGMLDHRDSKKRKILDDIVVKYICKEEQSVTTIKGDKKDRAFTRGTMPKSKEKAVGRPRKEGK